jgi:hypothetical protein
MISPSQSLQTITADFPSDVFVHRARRVDNDQEDAPEKSIKDDLVSWRRRWAVVTPTTLRTSLAYSKVAQMFAFKPIK